MAGYGRPAALRLLRRDVAGDLARRGRAGDERRPPPPRDVAVTRPIRVAYTGGGTGGHIYPALGIDDALRAALADAPFERRFFGNRGGLEATLVTTMPLTFVPSAALQRRLSFGTLRTFARNAAGIAVALRALLAYRPAFVIATGGYVCFPVVVAARILALTRLLAVRIALLEMNATPGLTNRLVAPLVDEVWITYAQSRKFFGSKSVLTGAPVRASLTARAAPAQARAALGLDPGRPTIVVMGGSQGARSINDALVALVHAPDIDPAWQFLHICGERDHAVMARAYADVVAGRVRLVAYLADPGPAYAAADIAVARAGASTLAELAVTATPAILVPYPHAADDHQRANAAAFAANGAAVVVPDIDLRAGALAAMLRACLLPETRETMRRAAAALVPAGADSTVADRVVSYLRARVTPAASPNGKVRG